MEKAMVAARRMSMRATRAEMAAVMTFTQASIQKTGIQVVMTSRMWVEPQAMMKSAKPMTNQAQSRAMTRPVRRAR
jgi:hypothetical protein